MNTTKQQIGEGNAPRESQWEKSKKNIFPAQAWQVTKADYWDGWVDGSNYQISISRKPTGDSK